MSTADDSRAPERPALIVYLVAQRRTIKSLAAEVGVTRTYLNEICSGRRHPSAALRARIATALDTHEGDLFNI